MFLQILGLARTALKLRNKSSTTAPQPRKPRSRSANLRLFAIHPILCTAVALLLSVLCVYAGHEPGMMEDYAVFTLNTSRIGENMLQNLDNKIRAVHFKRSEPIISLPVSTITATPTITLAPTTMITVAPRGVFSEISSDAASLDGQASSAFHSVSSAVHSKVTSVESGVASAATSALGAVESNVINAVNKAYEGLISDLHLQDFYSIHISSGCTGTYVFQNGTNVTVGDSGLPAAKGRDSVSRHVDTCSPHSALDPMSLIRIVYWIGIVFTAVALCTGIAGVVLLSSSRGRKMALVNILVTLIAFTFMGLASAVTHGLSLGATKLINFVGSDIGIAGYMGAKFFTLTWGTTVLLLVSLACWILLFWLYGRPEGNGVAPVGQGAGFFSFREKESSRPDRTSGVAMLPISRPQQPQPVHDRNGVPMI